MCGSGHKDSRSLASLESRVWLFKTKGEKRVLVILDTSE